MAVNKKRAAELEALIQKYQASYYEGEAEISDGEFDLLWNELEALNPDSPVLARVGEGRGIDGFPKATHLIPMGSQSKAANAGEFLAWAKKNGMDAVAAADGDAGSGKKFSVQYKLDGSSLELQYAAGRLKRAVTRGDGVTGDDITANALAMKGVPKSLDESFSGGVRGEVVMSRQVWQEKYSDKANCRNAANGIMKRKEPEGCRDLEFIAYDAARVPAAGEQSAGAESAGGFENEIEKIAWLKKLGFQTAVTEVFSSAQEIIAYREEVSRKRDSIPFDIDGLVVKDIEIDMEDLRRARPEKQIAFKFELETAFSILREVQWSESGATYTPIGIIDPVRLAGTTVKRANLNNPGLIRSMSLKIGSAVSVVKRGEIIPKIEGLAPAGALAAGVEQEIRFPETCASCGTGLVDEGTRLFCPNSGCEKRLLARLEKWVAVLDIRELGEKLIAALFEKKRARRIHELYSLTEEELAGYERMGKLSAAKVVRHIKTRRELSLAAFVAGFNIEGIAETTLEKVAAAGFDTLEKMRSASVEGLAGVHGLGNITASVLAEGLKECAAEMDAVLETGFVAIAPPAAGQALPLKGLSFCFTGELKSMKRSAAQEKAKALGADVKSAVAKGLSFLVTNDPDSGSAKNKKAAGLGIAVIGEEAFLEILKKGPGGRASTGGQGELF
ncbi:MAG: NAD-dependent DNA ligase LigA [Spirochaetes bacterium]|nr:NAD-dependent DNA ligase LigA [Spirochaetota bacterium]